MSSPAAPNDSREPQQLPVPDRSAPPGGGPGAIGAVDHGISALNAWIGDFLARSDNGLQQKMAFYRDNLPVDPESIEIDADSRLCVLVHGLGCNEAMWRFEDDGAATDYGDWLQRSRGFTPLYLRYNTGLRVSENGAQLAQLLERLCKGPAGPPKQLVLVGHSMGGLVIRSACHQASQQELRWVPAVSHAVYLGSPHLGAPLEKVANVASNLLDLFDTTATRVIGDLVRTRSAGIKDMRFGNLVEEDWLDHDPDELLQDRRVPVPWLRGTIHCRVVAVLGPRPEAPVSRLFGDAMVRAPSAEGQGLPSNTPTSRSGPLGPVRVIPELSHLQLAHSPQVARQIESWIHAS